ncbi:MAG: hypothetical protein WBE92_04295 [Steroidobacteraceae bacterium]
MNRHLILKRDDSQVTAAELGNCCPESKPVVLLPFGSQRILDDGNAPLLFQVRSLPEHLRLKVLGKEELHVQKPGNGLISGGCSFYYTEVLTNSVDLGFERRDDDFIRYRVAAGTWG